MLADFVIGDAIGGALIGSAFTFFLVAILVGRTVGRRLDDLHVAVQELKARNQQAIDERYHDYIPDDELWKWLLKNGNEE